MKNVLFLLVSLWVVGLSSASVAQQAINQQAVKKIPVNSTEYQDIYYLEHLPADYASSTQAYPVLIFLHGAGEQGSPGGQEIAKVLDNGPPKLIEQGDAMTFTVDGTEESLIVISPQLQYATKDNWSASYIHDVVQHVLRTYRVDPDRVYLTGLSMGGGTLWNYQGQHPNVAAAIAILSSGWPYDPFLVQQAIDHHLPVWAFHSQGDPVISVAVPQQWQDSLVTLGADPAPKLTIYPQAYHNTWDKGYATDHTYEDPNVYEWLLKQRRYNTAPPDNQSPVAEAGANMAVQLPVDELLLDGSTSSDPDGTIATYTWSQVSGPTKATLANENTRQATVRDLAEGVYVFELQVIDNKGAKATDQIQVTATAALPPANQPPIAQAGADTTVQLPIEQLQLNAYGSTDPDGSIVTYAWSQVSGPTEATLSGQATNLLTITDVGEGSYTFQLQVIDDGGAEAIDQVQVTITAAPEIPNEPPVAQAGADITVQLPVDQLQLNGKASTDPDGTVETYTWSQVEGPTDATLSGQSTMLLTIADMREGSYTFELLVRDDQGAEAIDQVRVTVTAAPEVPNEPPVAQAGADTIAQLPIEQLSLDGRGSTDPNDTIATYGWTQVSGPAGATLAGQDSSVLTLSTLGEGTYVFQLQVTDQAGATATDLVQVTVTPEMVTALGDDPRSARPLTAYPNPAHHRMTILFGDPVTRQGTLVLTNVLGKIVRHWELSTLRGNNQLPIDTKTIPAGMYLLQLRADRQPYTTKVFIEH